MANFIMLLVLLWTRAIFEKIGLRFPATIQPSQPTETVTVVQSLISTVTIFDAASPHDPGQNYTSPPDLGQALALHRTPQAAHTAHLFHYLLNLLSRQDLILLSMVVLLAFSTGLLADRYLFARRRVTGGIVPPPFQPIPQPDIFALVESARALSATNSQLQERLKGMQATQTALEQECNEMESALRSAETSKQYLQFAAHKDATRIATLEAQLRSARRAELSRDAQNRVNAAKLGQTMAEYKASEAQEKLEKTLTALTALEESQSPSVDHYEEQISALEESLKSAKQAVSEPARRLITTAEQKQKVAETELERNAQQLKKAHEDQAREQATFAKERETFNARIEQLNIADVDRKKQVTEAREQRDKAQASLAIERKDLENKIEALESDSKTQLDQIREELAGVQTGFARERGELNARIEAMVATEEDHRTQLDSALEEQNRLQAILAEERLELTGQRETVALINLDREDLNEKITLLKRTNGELQKQLDDLRSVKQESLSGTTTATAQPKPSQAADVAALTPPDAAAKDGSEGQDTKRDDDNDHDHDDHTDLGGGSAIKDPIHAMPTASSESQLGQPPTPFETTLSHEHQPLMVNPTPLSARTVPMEVSPAKPLPSAVNQNELATAQLIGSAPEAVMEDAVPGLSTPAPVVPNEMMEDVLDLPQSNDIVGIDNMNEEFYGSDNLQGTAVSSHVDDAMQDVAEPSQTTEAPTEALTEVDMADAQILAGQQWDFYGSTDMKDTSMAESIDDYDPFSNADVDPGLLKEARRALDSGPPLPSLSVSPVDRQLETSSFAHEVQSPAARPLWDPPSPSQNDPPKAATPPYLPDLDLTVDSVFAFAPIPGVASGLGLGPGIAARPSIMNRSTNTFAPSLPAVVPMFPPLRAIDDDRGNPRTPIDKRSTTTAAPSLPAKKVGTFTPPPAAPFEYVIRASPPSDDGLNDPEPDINWVQCAAGRFGHFPHDGDACDFCPQCHPCGKMGCLKAKVAVSDPFCPPHMMTETSTAGKRKIAMPRRLRATGTSQIPAPASTPGSTQLAPSQPSTTLSSTQEAEFRSVIIPWESHPDDDEEMLGPAERKVAASSSQPSRGQSTEEETDDESWLNPALRAVKPTTSQSTTPFSARQPSAGRQNGQTFTPGAPKDHGFLAGLLGSVESSSTKYSPPSFGGQVTQTGKRGIIAPAPSSNAAKKKDTTDQKSAAEQKETESEESEEE